MIYQKEKLLFVTGPCALESEQIARKAAETALSLQKQYPKLTVVFKSSFDKANRAKTGGARGLGMEAGLKLLAQIRKDYGLPILTDVHHPEQCAIVAEVADVLQIPAFLCRQTDLLEAAGKVGKAVNVKKGQFLSPYEMQFVVEKLKVVGAQEVWQTDRGTSFGYQNLVLDYRSFPIMSQWGHPVLFDSHCVQRPGTVGGQSGGDKQFIPALARAACAAGANGLYIEAHPEPEKAISDAATQLPLEALPRLVEQCLRIWEIALEG